VFTQTIGFDRDICEGDAESWEECVRREQLGPVKGAKDADAGICSNATALLYRNRTDPRPDFPELLV
jgi:hypothetical protein